MAVRPDAYYFNARYCDAADRGHRKRGILNILGRTLRGDDDGIFILRIPGLCICANDGDSAVNIANEEIANGL